MSYVLLSQVASATEASHKIQEELSALDVTLKNIEGARPFEELTVRHLGTTLYSSHSDLCLDQP